MTDQRSVGFAQGVCAALTVVLAMGEDAVADEIIGSNGPRVLLKHCDEQDELVLKAIREYIRRREIR